MNKVQFFNLIRSNRITECALKDENSEVIPLTSVCHVPMGNIFEFVDTNGDVIKSMQWHEFSRILKMAEHDINYQYTLQVCLRDGGVFYLHLILETGYNLFLLTEHGVENLEYVRNDIPWLDCFVDKPVSIQMATHSPVYDEYLDNGTPVFIPSLCINYKSFNYTVSERESMPCITLTDQDTGAQLNAMGITSIFQLSSNEDTKNVYLLCCDNGEIKISDVDAQIN